MHLFSITSKEEKVKSPKSKNKKENPLSLDVPLSWWLNYLQSDLQSDAFWDLQTRHLLFSGPTLDQTLEIGDPCSPSSRVQAMLQICTNTSRWRSAPLRLHCISAEENRRWRREEVCCKGTGIQIRSRNKSLLLLFPRVFFRIFWSWTKRTTCVLTHKIKQKSL